MFGALLYFVSVAVLTGGGLRDPRPAVRLASAALVALAVPILVLVLVARFGVDASPVLVIATHALLWIAAMIRRGRRGRFEGGGALPFAFLAAVVALVSALLGPDPSEVVFADAWAHLAWSRTLAASSSLYAPGFPAFIATLTPFDALVGAFRSSSLVVHFALATQFLALADRPRAGGAAALAALVYLLVPVAGLRFDPAAPELLSAVFLAGSWWVLRDDRRGAPERIVALGASTLVALVCHVSALQIAMLLGLGLAIVAGAGGGGLAFRAATLCAVGFGVVGALALSPSFFALVFAPESVPLVALQPGSVRVITLRSLVAGLGIGLGGLLLLGVTRTGRGWRDLTARDRALFAGLLLGAVALLLPIALAIFEIRVPLQLFTERLLMSAALPLALLAAAMLDRDRARSGGLDLTLVLAIVVVALAQFVRPVAAWSNLGLAVAVGAIALLALRGLPQRAWSSLTAATVALGLAVRLWIWTPEPTPVVEWLRAAPAAIPVLTNWPVTNELDALVNAPIVDGLAGRDANTALHRGSFSTDLRDRLTWCGDGDDVRGLGDYLGAAGIMECYVLVDDRFRSAWQAYRAQHDAARIEPRPGADLLLSAPPCTNEDAERLAAMRRMLVEWPRAEVVFEAPGVTMYHVLDQGGR